MKMIDLARLGGWGGLAELQFRLSLFYSRRRERPNRLLLDAEPGCEGL